MRKREIFKRFRILIRLLSYFYSLFPKKIQTFFLIRNRRRTGCWGIAVRYALLKNLASSIGENVSIHPDVYLFNVQNLKIGDNVSVHPMTYIEAAGNVTIGNDVSIAHGVTIMSVNHGYDDLEIPIKDQPVPRKPVVIGNNVWIGAKAVILGGNTVLDGVVIGAGSVVTKDIQSNMVVVGVPAHVIKERGQ